MPRRAPRLRRPTAAVAVTLLLCLSLLLLWTPSAAADAAVAHKEEAAAAAAVTLNDDDGAESRWHEATGPGPTRPRKPHAKEKPKPKPPRGLQQQQQTPPPTRAPTRSPTRTPTRAPTRLPTRAPTASTKQPTRRPTFAPTRRPTARPTARPTQWPTTGPTRRAPPPSQVTLGGKSVDRVMAVVMAVLGAIALLSIVGAMAYWCCRRPAPACVASLCPRRGRNGGTGGAAASSSSNTTTGAGGHLAVASLYYDADEQAHPDRYAAFRTPPRRSGTLVGQPLDPLLPPRALPSASSPAPHAVVGPLSPPLSPLFDPFGRSAIEYMAPAGVWPPTPHAVWGAAASTAAAAAAAATAAVVAGQEEDEEDDYGELVRLLTVEAGEEEALALHPGDLRMEPLPFLTSRSARAAKYRGRLGCTLPPPLPVVAVANPVPVMGTPLPATDSTRDLGMVRGPEDEKAGAEEEEEGDSGVPVLVTVLFAPVAPGAAQAARDVLARLRAVTTAYPHLFTPLLGVCCRGDRRRVALVEGAWPGGRPLGEALPPLMTLSDEGAGGSTATRRRTAAFLRVGLQLAEALAHLHAAGLGHRDLRPANVLLDRRTLQAKLTGARVAALESPQRWQHQGAAEKAGEGDDDDDDSDMYLAPECWPAPSTSAPPSPPAAGAAAASADVYALAVLLWGVWARQRPFAGLRLSRLELQEAVCARGLRPTSAAASVAWASNAEDGTFNAAVAAAPPELPSAFEALLSEMWAPEPGARPGAALVAARLRALQAAME